MVKRHSPLVISAELSHSLRAVQRQEVSREEARAALGRMLQAALQLEFATLPVYLSASFSLGRTNEATGYLLRRVAIEEMLHFIIVANTLNAIGIAPDVKAAVPTFPCAVDVVDPPLNLELRSFSRDLVEEVFLRIETPEQPINFRFEAAPRPRTVGQFYGGIIDIIEADKIPGLFDVDPANRNAAVIPDPPAFRPIAYRDDSDQGRYPLPPSLDFRITNAVSAVRHLKWIVDQGEGTSRKDTDPIDASGLPAHYYRFVSILEGKYLVADANAPKGFSYSGGSLPFDPQDLHECDPNPSAAAYAAHDRVFLFMNRFNRAYSDMIEALITAFGSRDQTEAKAAYQVSIDRMRSMLAVPQAIYRAAKAAGVKAGVPFEYQRT